MKFTSFQAGKLYVRDSHPCIVEVGSKKTHFMSPLSIELGASYSEWNVFSEVTQILRDFGVTISYGITKLMTVSTKSHRECRSGSKKAPLPDLRSMDQASAGTALNHWAQALSNLTI